VRALAVLWWVGLAVAPAAADTSKLRKDDRSALIRKLEGTIKQAASQIRTVARPMSNNAYKVDLAVGLIERTVLQALGS